MTTRALLIRVLLFLAILGSVVTLDMLRPQGNYSLGPITYDSSTARPIEIRTPADLPNRFALRFDAFSNDDKSVTLVQTSGRSGPALEIAIERPRRLELILFGFGALPITLSDSFALQRWHHFTVSGRADGDFDVAVDGAVTHIRRSAIQQVQSSAEIGSTDFTLRFKAIGIGTAFPRFVQTSMPRAHVRIANLTFTSRYIKRLPWALIVLAESLVALAVLWVLFPLLARIRQPDVSRSDIIGLCVFVASTGIGFLADAGLSAGKWAIWLAIGVGAVLSAGLSWRFRALPVPRRTAAFVVSAVFALTVASLLTLPNWVVAARMFERWPLTSMFTLMVALCVAALILEAVVRPASLSRAAPWVSWFPYLAFALLAIRTDSVFAPINALHWDYFVGPIRALREGGWLLWDVPSQYGFLNILIPAALPIHPAVSAFYWVQAAALFSASAVFYRTLYAVLRVPWLAACVVVIVFFFLADPLLIGPTGYPSESAVRFLWCYVLLAMAASNFLGTSPSVVRFARLGTLVWLSGLLWSAEGAIYTTVIFFAPLCLDLILRWRDRASARAILAAALELFCVPLISVAALFGIVNGVYLIALHHAPDWSMFVAYTRSYGGGYGERPVPFLGPLWAIGLVLFSGAATFVALRPKPADGPAYAIAAATSAVWIVSSYYVGRAYPIVVTMLSPIIVLALFTIIRAGVARGKTPLAAVIALPLVALGLFSVFWNAEAPRMIKQVVAPNVNAWVRLPEANAELDALLRQARITTVTPVVYYDTWVAMPRAAEGPYDRSWLPTPLQELEDPIPASMRDKVVTRFVMRHRLSGYLVEVMTGSNAPKQAGAWKTFLSRFYDIREIAHSENYRVLQFSVRSSIGAKVSP